MQALTELSYSPVNSEPYHNACCFWSLPFSAFPRTLIREKHTNLEPALWTEVNFITEQTDAGKSQQMALRANCFLILFRFAPGPNLIIRLLHFEFPNIILVIYGLWNDIFPLDILCIIFWKQEIWQLGSAQFGFLLECAGQTSYIYIYKLYIYKHVDEYSNKKRRREKKKKALTRKDQTRNKLCDSIPPGGSRNGFDFGWRLTHVVVVLGLRHWFFRNGEQVFIQFYWSLYAIFVNGANLLDFWERVDDVFMVHSKLNLPVHNFVQYLETFFAELSEILSE